MEHLNRQLAVYSTRLLTDVELHADEAKKVATHVSAEVRFLPTHLKDEIRTASDVPLNSRFEELVAFQRFCDFAISINNAALTRAHIIVQNYICFVYLKDSCFEILGKKAGTHSVTAKCASYLSTGIVRDFRNAFSHANWKYNPSFTGLECWVREEPLNPRSPMRQFFVSQDDLNFWQMLARCVAYATYEQLK